MSQVVGLTTATSLGFEDLAFVADDVGKCAETARGQRCDRHLRVQVARQLCVRGVFGQRGELDEVQMRGANGANEFAVKACVSTWQDMAPFCPVPCVPPARLSLSRMGYSQSSGRTDRCIVSCARRQTTTHIYFTPLINSDCILGSIPMIMMGATAEGGIKFNAVIRGLPVYLDNDSLIDIAKGDADRRKRFVALFQGGADLLFSVTNAIDLSGPQGKSADAVRVFLDELGPNWFPVELDAHMVLTREMNGVVGPEKALSQQFAKDFVKFVTRPAAYPAGSGKVISCGPELFSLGSVLDWMQPQRDSLAQGKADLDAALIDRIAGYRRKYEQDPKWLDEQFPELKPFRPDLPVAFVYSNLIRLLVLEAKAYTLKKGDGVDFCHAVIASAFARATTLDKQWKRRMEGLPQPNDLAKMFYRPQLDLMLRSLEAAVVQLQARNGDRKPQQ